MLERFSALLLLACACQGTIEGPARGRSGTGADTPSSAVPGQQAAANCSSSASGGRLLRRLTRDEFEANTREALQLDQAVWSGPELPPDAASTNDFTNNAATLRIDEAYAGKLLDSAELAATAHVGAQLPDCSGAADDSCVTATLDGLALRLYQRPLASHERARYLALFDTVSANGDGFDVWLKWAVTAMLASPHAIFRKEIGVGAGDGTYALSAHELVSALSYLTRGRGAESVLLGRAEAIASEGPAALLREARVLLFDDGGALRPEAQSRLQSFFSQWLGSAGLVVTQRALPEFEAARESMALELEQFISSVLGSGGGVRELLTSNTTYLDARLRAFYGFGSGTSEGFGPELRPAGYGVGLLAQGAMLSVHAASDASHPSKRGSFVRERLLCQAMPPPPAIVPELAAPSGGQTTRSRFAAHASDPACASCHHLIDGIGFGLEAFDGTGRYRTEDNGVAIDATGVLSLDSSEHDFDGAEELASLLAETPEVSACAADMLAGYAFGLLEGEAHELDCQARERLRSGEIGLLDYYLELTQLPYFASRAD
jgi:hypothetical protein